MLFLSRPTSFSGDEVSAKCDDRESISRVCASGADGEKMDAFGADFGGDSGILRDIIGENSDVGADVGGDTTRGTAGVGIGMVATDWENSLREGDPDGIAEYSMNWDDVTVDECRLATEVMALSAENSDVIEKFDTACSRCISGVQSRISAVDVKHNIVIKGFNNAQSSVTAVGTNCDGKTEYFVDSMPGDLALLCANDYVEDGAAILFHGDGVVVQLSRDEQIALRKYVAQFPVMKQLTVKNRTYEVDRGAELAYASSNYFNTKVNVNTKEERILSYLLTGLTLRDIQSAVRNGSVTGFHPEVTTAALSNFESKWGRTPDVVQMAYPNKQGNVKGYMSKPRVYTRVGERVEVDFMESDFNDDSFDQPVSEGDSCLVRKKVKKLATHGGAIAAYVSYDVYSGMTHGRLVKSVAKAVECVKETVEIYRTHGHTVSELAADKGILSEGKFRVATSETKAYCLSQGVKMAGAEPYNHSNGTEHVERVIQVIGKLIRMAISYALQNPNMKHMKFTKREILMLWGELFNWALCVISMKESPNNKGHARSELFTGDTPNVQIIRMLPIFSVLLVYRHVPNASSLDGANKSFYQYGLYVGPEPLVVGGIRVAVKTNNTVQIVVSSKYKCVTDGGSIDIYPSVQRGLRRMLEESEEEEAVEVPVTVEPPVPIQPPLLLPASRDDVAVSSPGPARASPNLRGGEHTSSHEPIPEVVQNISSVTSDGGEVSGPSVSVPRNKSRKRRKAAREVDRSSWGTREERLLRRNSAKEVADSVEVKEETLCEAYFADWSAVIDCRYYFSVTENAFYSVTNEVESDSKVTVTEGYRAVTEGVPKTYTEALADVVWGPAARTEWNTLAETRAIVAVDTEVAQEAIKNGADLVVLFPVYESKIKDNVEVKKVRLVGDGRTQYGAGNTYSPTPSREELKILLHLAATFDWDIVHVDEVRAFLNAEYTGETKVYAKLKGDRRYYEVLKALYGLKTSPRHYNEVVVKRLKELGFTHVHCSPQLFILRDITTGSLVVIYDFVDDFVITGSNIGDIRNFVDVFTTIANTTKPVWNPEVLLGLELERDRERRVIKVTMKHKIQQLADQCGMLGSKAKHVPIPQSGYVVEDYEFELMSDKSAEYLGKKDITNYMQIVGSLIWLTDVRVDITFATTYTAWFTKAPRRHHLDMSRHVVAYLLHSIDVPLVLGGKGKLGILTDSDASLATGPRRRSILGMAIRLGLRAGVISAKAVASALLHSSSFECELDSCSRALKLVRYVFNVIYALGLPQEKPVLYCDNEAMINFVKGEGVAKGVRHMEVRMWYTREQYQMGNVDVVWKSGKTLVADKLTKLANRLDQQEFMHDVQGLSLLT